MLNYYTSEQGKQLEKRVENVEQGGGGGSGYVEIGTFEADEAGYISFDYDTPLDVFSMIIFEDLDRQSNRFIGVRAVCATNPESDTKALRPGLFTQAVTAGVDNERFMHFIPVFNLPEELESDDNGVWLEINSDGASEEKPYFAELEIDDPSYVFAEGDHIKVYAKLTEPFNAVRIARTSL